MKLASVKINGTESLVAAVSDDEVVRTADLVSGLCTMEDLLAAGAGALKQLQERLPSASARHSIDALSWLPPVPRPQKILNVALNNNAIDAHLIYRAPVPAFFSKPVSSLQGHLRPIRIEPHYGLTHPEPELALVIARGGRNIAKADVFEHVLGYTIANDVTSAGMRQEDRFHGRVPGSAGYPPTEEVLTYPARYKGCDTFSPVGPWLVTKDEVAKPDQLGIRCWLDDDLMFEDSTAYYTYGVADVVYWISAHITLSAGDIICMGTGARSQGGRVSLNDADFSRKGSVVKVQIDGLGTLENPIERVDAADPRLEVARRR